VATIRDARKTREGGTLKALLWSHIPVREAGIKLLRIKNLKALLWSQIPIKERDMKSSKIKLFYIIVFFFLSLLIAGALPNILSV